MRSINRFWPATKLSSEYLTNLLFSRNFLDCFLALKTFKAQILSYLPQRDSPVMLKGSLRCKCRLLGVCLHYFYD